MSKGKRVWQVHTLGKTMMAQTNGFTLPNYHLYSLNLRPAEDIIENVNERQREWIKDVSDWTCPKRESSSETSKSAHHDANNENHQHFGWEVPRQSPDVNKCQENRQAENVIHGYCSIKLHWGTQRLGFIYRVAWWSDKWGNKKLTSENVNDAVLCFLRVAKIMADTASLELVANGNAINEMKNDGILVAVEKLSTASTSGSANAAAIKVPSSSISTALKEIHLGFSTCSTTSSLCSSDPNKACSLLVCCRFAR